MIVDSSATTPLPVGQGIGHLGMDSYEVVGGHARNSSLMPHRAREGMSMHIATLGDVVLDVIVDVPGGLNLDDDAEASITLVGRRPGGQRRGLGSSPGRRGHLDRPARRFRCGRLDRETPCQQGDSLHRHTSRARRDGRVDRVRWDSARWPPMPATRPGWPGSLPTCCRPDLDWLHLSGYPLLRAAEPLVVLPAIERAKSAGRQGEHRSVSAALIRSFGAAAFAGSADRDRHRTWSSPTPRSGGRSGWPRPAALRPRPQAGRSGRQR